MAYPMHKETNPTTYVTPKTLEELIGSYTGDEEVRMPRTMKLKDYVAAAATGKIDDCPEGQRPDKEDLSKQQGIMGVVARDNSLGEIHIRILRKEEEGLLNGYKCAVVDGGHRHRTFIFFFQDKVPFGEFAKALGKQGLVELHTLTWSELNKRYPTIAKKIENYKISFQIYFNMSDERFTQQFQDLNISTQVNAQERRNAHIRNCVARFVRRRVRIIKTVENTPHKLWDLKILGFKFSSMNYDEHLARMLNVIVNEGNPFTINGDRELDDLYSQYGSEWNREGEWVKNDKLFTEAKEELEIIENMLYKILLQFPSGKDNESGRKFEKKTGSLFTALYRFLFAIRQELQHEGTHGWFINVIEDPVKFAKEFEKLYNELKWDTTTSTKWVQNQKKPRAKGEAFLGFLGIHNTEQKIGITIDWMMEKFNSRYAEFGLKPFDSERTFPSEMSTERWLKVDKIDEVIEFKIKPDDVEGGHNIPWSAGVLAGGVTELHNLVSLHKIINRSMSDRNFKEYKESGDWKKHIDKIEGSV